MHEAHDIAVIHMAVKGRIHLHRHTVDKHQAILYLLFYLFCQFQTHMGTAAVSQWSEKVILGDTSSPALISRWA